MLLAALKSNCGKCPKWGVSVSVSGLYRECDGGKWSFVRAECPIIQNAKLPPYEQDVKYKYMTCSDYASCPLYSQFQPSTTLDI